MVENRADGLKLTNVVRFIFLTIHYFEFFPSFVSFLTMHILNSRYQNSQKEFRNNSDYDAPNRNDVRPDESNTNFLHFAKKAAVVKIHSPPPLPEKR